MQKDFTLRNERRSIVALYELTAIQSQQEICSMQRVVDSEVVGGLVELQREVSKRLGPLLKCL